MVQIHYVWLKTTLNTYLKTMLNTYVIYASKYGIRDGSTCRDTVKSRNAASSVMLNRALAGVQGWTLHPEKDSVISIRDQAQKVLFYDITSSVTGAKVDAAFSCGGTLNRPVSLRWDGRDSSNKITFGRAGFSLNNLLEDVERMCDACQPASFGRQEQEVYDNEYREALELEPQNFSTDFHPHDHGILENLAQTLLTAYQGYQRDEDLLGVRAEIYKLNVYRRPTGKFKSHVDTPKSSNHIGSLVVCLPYPREGGI